MGLCFGKPCAAELLDPCMWVCLQREAPKSRGAASTPHSLPKKTFKHGLDTYRLPKGSSLSNRLHAQRLTWDYWGRSGNKNKPVPLQNWDFKSTC